MLSAIIFDLDGTLLDTLADLAFAVNQVILAEGFPAIPVDAFRQMVGTGARSLMRQAYARSAAGAVMAEASLDHLLEAFQLAYAACWHDRTQPYPGIAKLLHDLDEAGISLGVLSNKPDAFTQEMTSRYFGPGSFAVIAGQREDWPLKPDPALALDVCRRLGATPQETALVGDSGSDMETALRAGMLPLGVAWGFRSAAELTSHGARALFQDPAELGRYLLAQTKAGDSL